MHACIVRGSRRKHLSVGEHEYERRGVGICAFRSLAFLYERERERERESRGILSSESPSVGALRRGREVLIRSAGARFGSLSSSVQSRLRVLERRRSSRCVASSFNFELSNVKQCSKSECENDRRIRCLSQKISTESITAGLKY